MKNKKKTDLRSGAKAAAEKPISNIDKNDKAVILARMHEIKKGRYFVHTEYDRIYADVQGRCMPDR